MKTAIIEFDEYPDKGFIVRLSPVPMDDWLDIDARLIAFKGTEQFIEMLERFCEVAFLGWENSDDAPTVANLRRTDFNVLLALIREWSKAIAEAPVPLPVRSASGGPSKAPKASRSRRS